MTLLPGTQRVQEFLLTQGETTGFDLNYLWKSNYVDKTDEELTWWP